MLLIVLALLAVEAAGAAALELESGAKHRGARTVRDRTALGGRAVLVRGRGSLVVSERSGAVASLQLRARALRCRGWPRLKVGVAAGSARSLTVRSRRWRNYSIRLSAAAGQHTYVLRLANPRRTRRCVRAVVADSATVVARRVPPIVSRPAAAAQPAAPPPLLYRNPVYSARGTADPMVLDAGGHHSDYWAYATGGGFPMLHSADLVHWEDAGHAMSGRPAWAAQTGDYHPWAPSVIERAGTYVMFYVSLNTALDPDTNCIGVATSSDPSGPFADRGILDDATATRDQSGRPLGCGDDAGYSNIDPAPFVDSGGQAYLYVSTTDRCQAPAPGASCPSGRTVSVIPLTTDLLEAAGPRQPLFGAGDQSWESAPWADVVENPWPIKRGGTYYLLYSGGAWDGRYGMGYATAAAPTGPFVKAPDNPVLRDNDNALSAGGGMSVTGPHGGDWVAYHGRSGSYGGARLLRVDPLRFPSSKLTIDGPSAGQSQLP